MTEVQRERHWRDDTDTNSEFFTHADISQLNGGQDMTVQIAKAIGGGIDVQDGKKPKRAVLLHFVGVERPLGLNPTNASKIEEMLGTGIYRRWVGQAITLYITRCDRPRKKTDPEPGPGENRKIINVPCVRVRPQKPPTGVAIYGVATAEPSTAPVEAQPDFDLDGWRATLAGCMTIAALDDCRADLNALGLRGAARTAIGAAIEAARTRIAAGGTL